MAERISRRTPSTAWRSRQAARPSVSDSAATATVSTSSGRSLEWHLRDRYTAWVNDREYVDCEILNASGTRHEPPSDSMLSCRREWDRTEFVRRIQEERPSVLDGSAVVLIVFGLACAPLIPSNPSLALVVVTFLVMAGLLLLAASARRAWVVRRARSRRRSGSAGSAGSGPSRSSGWRGWTSVASRRSCRGTRDSSWHSSTSMAETKPSSAR